MPRDICPFETGEGTHPDIVKLREQKRIDEVAAIDCELWIIDGLLCDLESRRARAQKTAAAPPVELGLQLLCATYEIRQIEPEQVVTFDHVRVALFDKRGKSPERVSFRLLNGVWIDNDEFFPTRVVRDCNAHDVIVAAFERQHFELHSFQCFKRQIFEQGAARGREVMLHRVRKREKIAPGALESVPQRDEFLPTIDGDQPAILEIAAEHLGFNAEIDNVAVGPDKWMERLDAGDCRSILLPTINFHRSCFAQFNRDDARRGISAEEQRVFFKFHRSSTDCADLRRFKAAPSPQSSQRSTRSRSLPEADAPIRVRKTCGNLCDL